jgi:glutaredoxin
MVSIARSPAASETTLFGEDASGKRKREEEMPVKLHRCGLMWVKIGAHPCWKVQKALNEAGIEYEVVPKPLSRSKRSEIAKLSGQTLYPVIEFEDGRVYREQSQKMAERIRAGKLLDAPTTTPKAGE